MRPTLCPTCLSRSTGTGVDGAGWDWHWQAESIGDDSWPSSSQPRRDRVRHARDNSQRARTEPATLSGADSLSCLSPL